MNESAKHILQSTEDAGEYFLSTYERLRARKHELLSAGPKDGNAEHADFEFSFSISASDFPEEDIDKTGMEFLIGAYHELIDRLNDELPPVSDPSTAAVCILRRHILSLAYDYLTMTIMFLAIDARYHPDPPVRFDMRGILSPNYASMSARMKTLGEALFVVLCMLAVEDSVALALFEHELHVLNLAGAAFFDTFDSVFDLKSIRKCRVGFDQLMQTVGSPGGIEAAANYVRRYKTMYREIVSFRQESVRLSAESVQQVVPSLVPKVDEIRQELCKQSKSIADISRAVSNMDSRLRKAIEVVKNIVRGFVRLFRPGRATPRPASVAKSLETEDRYPCLRRIKNKNRRLQLIAVIEYTHTHPIVHSGKNRDEFTLSNAAHVVWNDHKTAWSKLSGGFDTFAKLKASCYNLQNKGNDPFTYQV